ncbi:S26 family signal peptidase [Haoranjiania flava]|uniref:Signal peptidase I n=1 Tax=Haoranjiania flava TaxID=1856322 RepID=A0AAE3IMH5_9BACT|nr:S26 family signal peptidase [Haoranjiania flava]MCU7694324.1 S26 family signal peptidase [Haoranjiania flava]
MFWIYLIICFIGWHVGMYGMFRKAGIEPWKAFIPFYNTWLIVEKCGIKKIWFWLQLLPFAGIFITIWITIIFVMHFGKFDLLSHTLTVFAPFAYLPYLGFSKDVRWIGPEGVKHYKKSSLREWIDALVFATVAATIIRTFIFEAYVIPTGSMEKTLLINDFLFVNKMSYGARIPETPLSFPFVHNTMPGSSTRPSYVKWVKFPYKRLPGAGKVQRNDVVVFNFPAGDTIINEAGFGSARPYYDVLREQFNGNREALRYEYPDILVHPRDKTDNYIKRCTGLPGDTVYLKESILYINGQPAVVPPNSQMAYVVTTNGQSIPNDFLQDEMHVKLVPVNASDSPEFEPMGNNLFRITMRPEDVNKLKTLPNVLSIVPDVDTTASSWIFPNGGTHRWSSDNFGPLYIPKKGATVELNAQNIDIYRRLITNYEGHTLIENNGQYIIDGKPASQYTFAYDYYWMMGDNRHRSQDSRFWGFVPETHIVGKASLIWFSWQNGPRWNRIFRSIK